MEMVYRSIYYFTQAYHRGEADAPVAYLGLSKRKGGKNQPQESQCELFAKERIG
jgi:hypothetical protein